MNVDFLKCVTGKILDNLKIDVGMIILAAIGTIIVKQQLS